jgi:hypothetical protein
MRVQEAFYSTAALTKILAVGTHTKSARDLEIMLRLLDRSNFATLGPLSMCMYASCVGARKERDKAAGGDKGKALRAGKRVRGKG